MTYLDAAHHILQQTRHPLHYRAITERALAAGLIQPTGLTPEATMGAESSAWPSGSRRTSTTRYSVSTTRPVHIAIIAPRRPKHESH